MLVSVRSDHVLRAYDQITCWERTIRSRVESVRSDHVLRAYDQITCWERTIRSRVESVRSDHVLRAYDQITCWERTIRSRVESVRSDHVLSVRSDHVLRAYDQITCWERTIRSRVESVRSDHVLRAYDQITCWERPVCACGGFSPSWTSTVSPFLVSPTGWSRSTLSDQPRTEPSPSRPACWSLQTCPRSERSGNSRESSEIVPGTSGYKTKKHKGEIKHKKCRTKFK